MTKEEIIEGNKLIVEFMKSEKDWSHLRTSRYNASWDWLMPVVDKIVQNPLNISPRIHRVYINTFRCKKNRPKYEFDYKIRIHTDFRDLDIKVDSNNELEGTFVAIVKFINWYNQEIKHPPIEES